MNLTHEERIVLAAILDAKIEAMERIVSVLTITAESRRRNVKHPEKIADAKKEIELLKSIRQKI